MANYQFSQDLKLDVLFRAGEPTSGDSDWETRVMDYLNRVYQSIWLGGQELVPDINEDWLWLRRRGVFILEPKHTTGTITLTNGQAAFAFSSAPADSKAGWLVEVAGQRDIFRIAGHTGGSTIASLDGNWTGDSLTNTAYKIYKIEYTLAADVLKLISPMFCSRGHVRWPSGHEGRIDGIDDPSLRSFFPLGSIPERVPQTFAQVDNTTVVFNAYPAEQVRVEYPYLYRPDPLTDSAMQEPAVPREHRKTIADYALYFIQLDKNDRRADATGLLAQQGLRAMAIENRNKLVHLGQNFGKIYPRQGQLSRRGFFWRREYD